MDDKRIIELFFARSDKAIDELDKKYGLDKFTVSDFIIDELHSLRKD